ncbi:hemolysin III family protein [Rhodococcus sp. D2-41]|uniref:Hemolysin III family protein n=1 Tax=Speluncibacter jeojiensis TaxID=2710754 RepID=A0A9X4LYH2_9ACTN|nr:hemolysin III family protein [Rhodococcus sp. D2-41]MDG3012327.1 hemolysin III family protein [Rhodococcus sp. D2-41]MDG3014698.1 hemolysin III family protein [Corynebacteriales bacterium D3-21]
MVKPQAAPETHPVKPRMRGWIHLWACSVAVVAGITLVAVSWPLVGTRAALATAIYSLTVCGLFGVSATYHRITWRTVRARTRMKRADHSMIFVFIAGSYTPFAMFGLPPSTGRVVLAVVWTGALAGVVLKMLWPTAPRWVGVPLYLLLGWVIVFVAPTLVHTAGIAPMVLLAVGGVFYSVGAVLYATKWPDPWPATFGHHEFFHAATAVAAICHLVAVWLVVFG